MAGRPRPCESYERAAERANLLEEAHSDERLIEPGVEQIGGRRDDPLGHNPERLLPRLGLRLEHRQTRVQVNSKMTAETHKHELFQKPP